MLLFQVEAALTSDPTNEELMQLKQDLSQVIELTSQLVTAGTAPEQVTEPEPTKVIGSDIVNIRSVKIQYYHC